MKIIVLGGGVIGTCTAYYLSKDGHQVSVFDRRERTAEETSYANAGLLSYAHSGPWATPNILSNITDWMRSRYSPVIIRPNLSWRMWYFMLSMLLQCNERSYSRNKADIQMLADLSKHCLDQIRHEHNIRYNDLQHGILQIFRTEKNITDSKRDAALLKKFDRSGTFCSAEECRALEPGLNPETTILGGFHLPQDQSGDCRLFTRALTSITEKLGATFHYNTNILHIHKNGRRVTEVHTDRGKYTADAYVVALGSYTQQLTRLFGLVPRIYPVKGYSLTLPIKNEDAAPRAAVVDEQYKVAITRLGNHIRVAGTVEFSGYNLRLYEKRRHMLLGILNELYPGAGDTTQVEFWCGLRPMTPSGIPVLGPSPYENLYLNSGHGPLGWTLACGSGKLLADLIAGRKTAISMPA